MFSSKNELCIMLCIYFINNDRSKSWNINFHKYKHCHWNSTNILILGKSLSNNAKQIFPIINKYPKK
jgi:hypothetical protein